MKKPAVSRSQAPIHLPHQVDPLREAARVAYDTARAARQAAAKLHPKGRPR